MEFILITTNHTPAEIQQIVLKMSKEQRDALTNFYDNHSYYEFIDMDELQCAYFVVEKEQLKWLLIQFVTLEVIFSYINCTQKVLWEQPLSETIIDIVFSDLKHNFVLNNLTPDIILDKISAIGSSSLTQLDKKILRSV